MTRQVREAPRSPRELDARCPRRWRQRCWLSTAKSPRGRFQTALDAAQAFSAAMNMTFDSTGAFANWRNWDNLSGPVNVANIPGLTSPGWFARLFARIGKRSDMSSSADGHPTTAEEMETLRVAQAQPGDVVGSYRVLRLIGEGAVGRVFEVEHVKIGRRAAMKVLAEHALRPLAVRRLFSEAQAVNRINHPHIVEITDVVDAEQPGGASGVVMELLEGQSLAQMMIREGPVPPERFIPILIQVADALSAAHAAGFVHRDLKPENIFLTQRHGQADYVKLLDFGLAKSLAPDSEPPPPPARPSSASTRPSSTLLERRPTPRPSRPRASRWIPVRPVFAGRDPVRDVVRAAAVRGPTWASTW